MLSKSEAAVLETYLLLTRFGSLLFSRVLRLAPNNA